VTASTDALAIPQWSYRWVRALAFAAIAFVVVSAFNTQPGPGLRGRHLAISASLLAIGAGITAMVRIRSCSVRVLTLLLLVVVIGSAVLVTYQPDGPGFFGVFPAVTGAALRLPRRYSVVVVAVAVAAVAVGWETAGGRPLQGVILNAFGIVAFYVVALFAQRLREANSRAHDLIVELEASRAAQAESAALAERQRLARDMHDVLAHTLSGLVLNLDAAHLLAQREDAAPAVTDALGRAQSLAKAGFDDARRAIGMLRGDELPGPERVAGLVDDFASDTGVACTFTVGGDERAVSSEARLALYRAAQEGLTNVRKHARAHRVEVRLNYEADGVRLTVEDFGARAAAPPGDEAGYGLTGMRERAELLGGRLDAAPTDSGFRIELWVPA
jgi:signal transduction histidine kinase